jgi:hypothetical protein
VDEGGNERSSEESHEPYSQRTYSLDSTNTRMTVEAAVLALRVEEQGADQVEAKLDKLDAKGKKLGAKPIELKLIAPTIERVDNQLEQLGKQAALYRSGLGFESTRAGSARELMDVEKQLQGIVGATTTTLEQRIVAEKALAGVSATTGPTMLASLTKFAAGYFTIQAALKVTEAAFGAVKNQIDLGDNLHDLSIRTGVSVESLSVLGQVAEKSGGDLGMLANGFKFLNKATEGALTGNKNMIDAFKDVGLSVDDLRNKTPEQILQLVATGLMGIEDPAVRATDATRLFGKAGDALLPTLKDLADGGFDRAKEKAESLGSVMSTAFSDKADAFNDDLVDMAKATGGLARAIAEGILPTLDSWVVKLTALIAKWNEWTHRAQDEEEWAKDFDKKHFPILGMIFGSVPMDALLKKGGPASTFDATLPLGLGKGAGGGTSWGDRKKSAAEIRADAEEAKKAEEARIKSIDDTISALVQLSSTHKLTSTDIGTVIGLEQQLQKEFDRTTTSIKRRGEITKELADLEKILPASFKLSDLRSITDTEHDPHLVGVDPLTGKMRSPFAGMTRKSFDPLSTASGQMAGKALEDLLSLQGGNASAALDVAYAKIQQYVANKEPIPIEVAIQLNDLAKATSDVEEQFQTFLPRVGQSFFESLGEGIGSGVGNGKDMLLGALGGIFGSMGRALVSYGLAMTGLLPHLLNPFTSGPAAIVAGTLLIALGAKLGSMASGGGGGGGNSGGGSTGPARPPKKDEDSAFAVAFDPDAKLRQTRSVVAPGVKTLGNKAMPDARPAVYIGQINALSPDHGEWQRSIAETYMNARDRGLIKDNG